jgi:hypothetical protein
MIACRVDRSLFYDDGLFLPMVCRDFDQDRPLESRHPMDCLSILDVFGL